jgi:hypothetical protein
MSDTHDVTISGFDLDRLESELAQAREQRDRLELWKATAQGLADRVVRQESELATAKQIMGELCESCGWAMRLPDQPCRFELERDLAAAKDALLKVHKDYGFELRDPNGTIWEHAAKVQQQRDRLAEALEGLMDEYIDRKAQWGNEYLWDKHECVEVIQAAQKAIAAAKGGTP